MRGCFVILVFLALLSHGAGGFEYSDCSNYPDAEMIVILDEAVREVSFTDTLTFASLPKGWYIKAEDEIPIEDVLNDVEDKGYLSKSSYGKTQFDHRYAQLFVSDDKSWVLVEIDYFKSPDTPRHIIEAYRKVISQAINVGDLRSTGTKYGAEGISCEVGDEYHIYFYDGVRFFMIYGNSSANVHLFAGLYADMESPMMVNEKYHWVAKVCKAGTDECTKDIYYAYKYEDVVMEECKVTHGEATTKCPDDRIEKYSGHIKVPFHSCNKDDILDLSYEKTTLFPILNEFWSPSDFYFNSTKPTDKFYLKLTTPEDVRLIHKSPQGLLSFYNGSDNRNVYVWERMRVPPYEREYYMPYTRKVVDKVTYTSMSSWSKIEKWFNSLYSGSVNTSAVQVKSQEITANASGSEVRIRQLYEWVRDNVRYEYSELGSMSGYKPNPAQEVMAYKFGDCKDHTILLLSMLGSVGVNAYPVLVARPNFEEDIPSPYEFYHSIVAVPEGDGFVWLDPTCSACPYGYTTPDVQGSYAMVLLDDKEGFTLIDDLDVDKLQVTEENVTINLSADGNALVDYTLLETGYPAVLNSDELDKPDSESVKKVLKDYINSVCSEGELRSFDIMTSKEDVGVFAIRLLIQCKKFASTSGDKILFDLGQEPMFYSVIKEEKRTFPIQFDGSIKVESHTTIVLPDGYSVEYVPEDFSVKEDFAEYESKFSKGGNSIYAYTKALVNEGEIPAARFPDFKKFFMQISSSSKKGIILSPAAEAKSMETTTYTMTTTTSPTLSPASLHSAGTSTTTNPTQEGGDNTTCLPLLSVVLAAVASIMAGIPYSLHKN